MSGFASIGECMIELSGAAGDNWRMGFAGDTFNTIWYVRALSAPDYAVDYVSAFGDDPFSRKQRDFFAENGIGIAKSPIISGARPGLYAITLDGAERSFTYWRSDAAARRLASDREALTASLKGRDIVYFSGITLAILAPADRQTLLEAIATARENGSRIAFDPNYRPRLWENVETARAAIGDAMRLADIALPTFPDEKDLFGDAVPTVTAARLTALGVKEIVVKDGTGPALVVAEGHEESVPAVTANAVDTTGAGDSFNGAYLSARLKGLAPADAARRAHCVAARVVEFHGALAPMDEAREAFEKLCEA
ncbi:2-dehydro-3-deoxygluconokinase [Paramesorhizobium deserti]|uniref:2-dehydro-3-deoxygluconokinase n=1 Tax=Paramesorhizobium deserti TaxID=1494590 RepID=A0A135HUS9_9HYPH|nr:sugar kinase [Paramesorhizobium deserti]KXF76942.1 2-dehydro-3-deoxygluconokinase [Paramesorhizobium deserti]